MQHSLIVHYHEAIKLVQVNDAKNARTSGTNITNKAQHIVNMSSKHRIK